ncbi:hypothetical protein IQ251_01520 [Saccharopolyspora sp. HNM0983]|uniref:SAV-6107-like HEPN domain-containing protein n=1 Tax=Saccharopolyspora montiporae TaxID=2781240 RepID=A0A929G005_9PSEU|nr:SAV_6107 family HEPN domain-containing protein [Saccharopolyspora sp. HNM0983]MBE9373118.1 hypothetical protein [Saccharopolyspora sp. HNM0983]
MTSSRDLSIPRPRHAADEPGTSPPPEAPAGAFSALLDARSRWHAAESAADPRARFVDAHAAALRAATALVVARAECLERPRPAGVWALLAEAAPELADWAEFLAGHSNRRALAESGVPVVTGPQADRLLVQSREFLDIVGRRLLGVAG